MVKPRPGGLGHLFALINDPAGLHSIDFNVITRKDLKRMRSELMEEHELELVEADWRYCDFLIHRSFEWARNRNKKVTGDYMAERALLLQQPPPREMDPLILSQFDPEAIQRDEQLLSQSEALLHEKEFRTWLPEENTLQPYLTEIREIDSSPLLLSEVQQKERLQACFDRATTDLFAGEQRSSYARRLQEMAYFLYATGREAESKQALAVSLALTQPQTAVTNIPFCTVLVRGALALAYSQSETEETQRQESSLLVTPRQFAAEQQERQRFGRR